MPKQEYKKYIDQSAMKSLNRKKMMKCNNLSVVIIESNG